MNMVPSAVILDGLDWPYPFWATRSTSILPDAEHSFLPLQGQTPNISMHNIWPAYQGLVAGSCFSRAMIHQVVQPFFSPVDTSVSFG